MDRVERGVLRQVIQVGSGRNSRSKYLGAILGSQGTFVGWLAYAARVSLSLSGEGRARGWQLGRWSGAGCASASGLPGCYSVCVNENDSVADR